MTSVGIDLGGHELTAVTVDAHGAIRARATRPNAPGDIGASLPSLIREMRAGSPTGIVGVALPQGHSPAGPS